MMEGKPGGRFVTYEQYKTFTLALVLSFIVRLLFQFFLEDNFPERFRYVVTAGVFLLSFIILADVIGYLAARKPNASTEMSDNFEYYKDLTVLYVVVIIAWSAVNVVALFANFYIDDLVNILLFFVIFFLFSAIFRRWHIYCIIRKKSHS